MAIVAGFGEGVKGGWGGTTDDRRRTAGAARSTSHAPFGQAPLFRGRHPPSAQGTGAGAVVFRRNSLALPATGSSTSAQMTINATLRPTATISTSILPSSLHAELWARLPIPDSPVRTVRAAHRLCHHRCRLAVVLIHAQETIQPRGRTLLVGPPRALQRASASV